MIQNASDRIIEISSFLISCDCLSFELNARRLGPGQTTDALIIVSVEDEPDFSGGLAITVQGLDSDEVVIDLIVRVKVHPAETKIKSDG